MKIFFWIVCFISLLNASYGYSHETLDTGSNTAAEISIKEMTGQTIPPDITFFDENGEKIKLGDMRGKPVLLTLVYYTCEHICPQMLEGLALALPRLSLQAGRDYRVITASFDPEDTPQRAKESRKNYIKAAGISFPEGAWKFLTGDSRNIQRLTESVGFRYRKDIHGFTHPVVLIFLTPEGKISRYFSVTKYEYGAAYPISFSSFDLNIAFAEAAQGKPVTELKRVLLYCFSHEPPGQSKFFYFIAVVGLVTLIAMVSFFVYLRVTEKKYRRKGWDSGDK
jgi:protein SCO1